MALNVSELIVIQHLIKCVPMPEGRPLRTLFLGYPDLLVGEEEVRRAGLDLDWAAIEKRPNAREIWKGHNQMHALDWEMPESKSLFRQLGADPVVLDAVEWGYEDIVLDLNLPLHPKIQAAIGKFDLIIDPGTTEHCFNVAQSLLTIADLLNPLGIVYHQTCHIYNHGFWRISPTALFDFYDSRGFILGTSYLWFKTDNPEARRMRFMPALPFDMHECPLNGASHVFQKPAKPKAMPAGEPFFPIQRCYTGKTRRVEMVDFIGDAVGPEAIAPRP